jgi:hypothetical protein
VLSLFWSGLGVFMLGYGAAMASADPMRGET